MSRKVRTVEVTWEGPCSWPGYEDRNKLPPIPNLPGVYLLTFKYQNGYLIYAAGLTRRPIPVRFKEHRLKYMDGDYNVLDISAAEQGIRKEIWHGWGYARDHRSEFEENKSKILDAMDKQLAGFYIFVANISGEDRFLERLEASIMNTLYKQITPISDIPDKGMQLSERRGSEEQSIVRNNCASILHGLPELLEI